MTHPKVSIILATYNRAHYIKEALDSILAQTYQNWECIIIDDRSTDNTAEIVNEYIEKDNRFIYFFKPESKPKGLPASRNVGLDLATGDYIVFVDDDDIVHPQLLEIGMYFFKKYNIHFFHYMKYPFFEQDKEKVLDLIKEKIPFRDTTDYYFLDNSKQHLYYDIFTGKLPMASCTVIWSAPTLKGKYFNEHLSYAEEREYYFRVFLNNINIVGLTFSNPLYFNRKHENSNTSYYYKKDKKMRDGYNKAIHLMSKELHILEKNFPKQIRNFIYYEHFQGRLHKIPSMIYYQRLEYFLFIFEWMLKRITLKIKKIF